MPNKATTYNASPSLAPRVALGDEPPSSRPARPSTPVLACPSPPGASRAPARAPLGGLTSLMVPRNEGEVIIDYPKPLEPVTAVRSTLITSSLMSLRERGLFERYDALQTSPHRQKIMNLVAGEWLPILAAVIISTALAIAVSALVMQAMVRGRRDGEEH